MTQPQKSQVILNLCKTLVDENRLRMIGLLAIAPRTISEMASQLNLKENAVSRHVARLRETGLVCETEQPETYRLDLEFVLATKKELFALEVGAAGTEDESDTAKILRRFLDGERLTQIPSKETYRLIILEWVAARFEVGVNYPERTVNEMLTRHFDDYAALRRALVDYGFMQREKGIYWRVKGQ